jgi:hypothetical protein
VPSLQNWRAEFKTKVNLNNGRYNPGDETSHVKFAILIALKQENSRNELEERND